MFPAVRFSVTGTTTRGRHQSVKVFESGKGLEIHFATAPAK
jgi:hypothetical protein